MLKSWSASTTLRSALLLTALAADAQGAWAAVITVGPDGAYGSIQTGLAVAVLAGGSNEIDVESGTYAEHLTLDMNAGTIVLVGGWNSTFTQHSLDPAATQIFGSGTARVLTATISGGKFTFSGLTLYGGSASDRGGAVYAQVSNTGSLEMRNAQFMLNSVSRSAPGNPFGGGIDVYMTDTAALIIDGADVSANSIASSADGWVANGAGVMIEALNSSDVSISNSNIHGNSATATGMAYARSGGLELALADSAHFSFSRSTVSDNTVSAQAVDHASYPGLFASANCAGACAADFTLDTFDRNNGNVSQLAVALGGTGAPKAYLADLVVSRGTSDGVMLTTDIGVANVVNLTIAGNAGLGLYLSPLSGSTLTAYNTIAFGNNSGDCGSTGAPVLGNNLCGIDPHFVDAAHGDFHIKPDSPGRDAAASSPPGGLGLFDRDGNPRVFGPNPDIGAYEVGDEIFKNGFN